MTTVIRAVGTLCILLLMTIGGIQVYEYSAFGGLRGAVTSNLVALLIVALYEGMLLALLVLLWRSE